MIFVPKVAHSASGSTGGKATLSNFEPKNLMPIDIVNRHCEQLTRFKRYRKSRGQGFMQNSKETIQPECVKSVSNFRQGYN